MQCMLLRSRQDIRQNTFLYSALQDDAELLLASRNKDVILNTFSEILGSSLTYPAYRPPHFNMMFKSITRLLFLSAISQATAQHISITHHHERTTCTVFPGKDNATDDVPTILKAFDQCGHGGNIIFPQNETYHINSRLNPRVNDVNIDWQGQWVVSPLFGLALASH